MLNAIGLQEVGVRRFLDEKLPRVRALGKTIIANICGSSLEEYGELARILDQADGVAAIEVNISCPNVAEGGIEFGCDPDMAARAVAVVRRGTTLPVIPKLSPSAADLGLVARRVEEAGADAVSLINTIPAMAIDVHTRRPRLANIIGGLSGPAIRPIAVRMVWEVSRATRLHGRRDWRDHRGRGCRGIPVGGSSRGPDRHDEFRGPGYLEAHRGRADRLLPEPPGGGGSRAHWRDGRRLREGILNPAVLPPWDGSAGTRGDRRRGGHLVAGAGPPAARPAGRRCLVLQDREGTLHCSRTGRGSRVHRCRPGVPRPQVPRYPGDRRRRGARRCPPSGQHSGCARLGRRRHGGSGGRGRRHGCRSRT